MKKYTHAWLAFMAIKRLNDAMKKSSYRNYAKDLIDWFMSHKDDVIQGAWYPDDVIKDMRSSHILKISPSDDSSNKYKKLPGTSLLYKHGNPKPFSEESFIVNKDTNLPDRCESIAHSVIDNLKMKEKENKGSPVTPTNNHIALLLFMLSHYVADAHMPFHCDSRQFSDKKCGNIHADVEEDWDKEIEKYYQIDKKNKRFIYDTKGYPIKDTSGMVYKQSFLKKVEDELKSRDFKITYGTGNNNVWDFMSATCQYSFLMSYNFIPKQYTHTNIPKNNDQWKSLGQISFDDLTVAVISDSIDSIARIWFRVWRRYLRWLKE